MLYSPGKRATKSVLEFSHIARRISQYVNAPRRVVFSGIQPTGIPHLGNYLGALQRWVQLQNDAEPSTELLYSLVDLHAITVRQSPAQLRQWKKESLATLLAIGLDPTRSILFYQSDVPEHSELQWILNCTASVGQLSRMTQWKSKLHLEDNAKPLESPLQLGLFSYPVLQAADVLLYRTTHVPVGADQVQHLEFARNCASNFNNAYGKVFVEPETVLSPAKRIMSLTRPGKKMSKSSQTPKSRIMITDSRETIFQKVRGAASDEESGITYDPQARPGISNLLDILYHLDESAAGSLDALVEDCKDLSKRAFKERVAATIDLKLAPIRAKYEEVMQEDEGRLLTEIAERGASRAAFRARGTMRLVKNAIGL